MNSNTLQQLLHSPDTGHSTRRHLQPNDRVLTPKRARHPISSPVTGEPAGARSLRRSRTRPGSTSADPPAAAGQSLPEETPAGLIRLVSFAPLTYFRGRFGRQEQANEKEAYRVLRDWVLTRQVPADQALDLPKLVQALQIDPENLSRALVKPSLEKLVTRTNSFTEKSRTAGRPEAAAQAT